MLAQGHPFPTCSSFTPEHEQQRPRLAVYRTPIGRWDLSDELLVEARGRLNWLAFLVMGIQAAALPLIPLGIGSWRPKAEGATLPITLALWFVSSTKRLRERIAIEWSLVC
jgi:hypothetical protein